MGDGKTKKVQMRGGVLLEAIFLLIPLILVLSLFLEIFRREVMSVLMIHSACLEVRAKVLGQSTSETEKQVRKFYIGALGNVLGNQVFNHIKQQFFYVSDPVQLSRLKLGTLTGGVSERFYRYPQWVRVSRKRDLKHHQEVTKRCLFPF